MSALKQTFQPIYRGDDVVFEFDAPDGADPVTYAAALTGASGDLAIGPGRESPTVVVSGGSITFDIPNLKIFATLPRTVTDDLVSAGNPNYLTLRLTTSDGKRQTIADGTAYILKGTNTTA